MPACDQRWCQVYRRVRRTSQHTGMEVWRLACGTPSPPPSSESQPAPILFGKHPSEASLPLHVLYVVWIATPICCEAYLVIVSNAVGGTDLLPLRGSLSTGRVESHHQQTIRVYFHSEFVQIPRPSVEAAERLALQLIGCVIGKGNDDGGRGWRRLLSGLG